MRGRKVEVGDTSCRVYVLHKKTCGEKGNNSPNSDCDCIKQVQFRDGSRKSTSEWKWSRAEDAARRLLSNRLGLIDSPAIKHQHTVEKAVDDWIEEREQNGIKRNDRAKRLTKKLVAWCQRNNILYLTQIEKQALRVWRTNEWKYANGDSASMKVHSSILGNFFQWCVDGDLLENSPCQS